MKPIDKKKLNIKLQAFLTKIEGVLKVDVEQGEKLYNRFYSELKSRNHPAIKTTAKAHTPDKKKLKSANKKNIDTISQSDDLKSHSDSIAKKKASEIAKSNASDKAKTLTASMTKLDKLIKSYPKLKGISGTNLDVDSRRVAKPKGKRKSKKGWKNQYGTSTGGNTYYENRDSKSDRLAPKYPKNAPLLKKGGEIEKKYFVWYKGKQHEFTAKSVYGAKKKAIKSLKVPKKYQSILAVMSEEKYNDSDFQFFQHGGLTDIQDLGIANADLFEDGGLTDIQDLGIANADLFKDGGVILDYYSPYHVYSLQLKDGTEIINDDQGTTDILNGVHVSKSEIPNKLVNEAQVRLFADGGNIFTNSRYIPRTEIKNVVVLEGVTIWETIKDSDKKTIPMTNVANGFWLHNAKHEDDLKRYKSALKGKNYITKDEQKRRKQANAYSGKKMYAEQGSLVYAGFDSQAKHPKDK